MDGRQSYFTALEKVLISAGSVFAAAIQIGDKAASEALHSLTLKAPEEMQPSWPLVLNWSQLQFAYETAESMGDADTMRKIVTDKNKMLRDLY